MNDHCKSVGGPVLCNTAEDLDTQQPPTAHLTMLNTGVVVFRICATYFGLCPQKQKKGQKQENSTVHFILNVGVPRHSEGVAVFENQFQKVYSVLLIIRCRLISHIWTPNTCIINAKRAVIHSSPTDNIMFILYEVSHLDSFEVQHI